MDGGGNPTRYEKIAPGLATAIESYHRGGAAAVAPLTRTMGLVAKENTTKPAHAIVFLHCDEEASLEGLSKAGIKVNQRAGAVRTAYLPLDALEALSEEEAVHRIIPSRTLRPLMDRAQAATHTRALRQKGLSGKGVVIGVVDSGIDSSHPAFGTRVLRIWDQELKGPGVSEGGYGAELVGPLLSVSRDNHGHGTHVAGIAGGQGTPYEGVAPGADLVVVKTDFNDAHISDGVRYVFRVARELKCPAVVNLSLGGHHDPHDGTDSLCQVIDAESGRGRIVCCAAGNEGNDNIHAQASVKKGGVKSIRFKVPSSTLADPVVAIWLNGWYSGQDEFEVAVQGPSGAATPYQGPLPALPDGKAYAIPDGVVQIATPGVVPLNGDCQILVTITGQPTVGYPVGGGTWKLKVRGKQVTNGRLDVWIQDNNDGMDALFTGGSVVDGMKVGSPGASKGAITVAAFTTRVAWTDIDGNPQAAGLDLDTICDFSSPGPLRDGAQKPDLAAPGAMIVAPYSADSPAARRELVDTRNRVMAGTSMATPFVTGLVALLLERQGDLDPAGVKSLLTQHSSIAARPPGTFDPKWGFGLIDAANL